MKYNQIQEIAVVYGEKELIEEFLDILNLDRAHDKAPIEAILLTGETKKEIKQIDKNVKLKNKLIKFCIKHFEDYKPEY